MTILKVKKPKRGKPDDYPDRAEFKKTILSIADETTRCLAIILYLTGCRISEIVGRKPHNVTYKYFSKRLNKEQVLTRERREVKGVTPSQFKQREKKGVKYYLITGLPVLKRRVKVNDRKVPVIPEDSDLVQMVLSYAQRKGIKPLQEIFDFERNQAYKRLQKALGKEEGTFALYCHYFRHACMNMKSEEEDYDAIELVNFGRYANIQHVTRYLEGKTKKIEQKTVDNYLKRQAEKKE